MSSLFSSILELSPWLSALVIFVLCLVISLLGSMLLFRMALFSFHFRSQLVKTSIRKRLGGSWLLFIPFILFHIFVGYTELPAHSINLLRKIMEVGAVVSVAVTVARLMRVIEDILLARYDISVADNLKARKVRTQIVYIHKIAVIIIVVLALAVILLSFDGVRKFGETILTGAGVAGIIIGFALQKTLANLFAGIQIAFTQPIKIDDAVVVEKEWGWIEEINLTYVVVRIWDKRRLVLPITYFTENTFQNWTRSSAQILGSVFLYTDYALPLMPLRRHFEQILQETELWDGEAQVLQVVECTEKTMQLRLLMTAKNSPTSWDLRCYVRERMITFIQENYPQCLPRTRAVLLGEDNESEPAPYSDSDADEMQAHSQLASPAAEKRE